MKKLPTPALFPFLADLQVMKLRDPKTGKMTWDPVADSDLWHNRTAETPGGGSGSIYDFPFSFVSYGGYCFALGVHPEDENIVLTRSDRKEALHSGQQNVIPRQKYYLTACK